MTCPPETPSAEACSARALSPQTHSASALFARVLPGPAPAQAALPATFAGCAAAILPATAQAHPGHLADLAGHHHWVAGAAIGAAVAAGVLGVLLGGRAGRPPAASDAGDAPANEADAGTNSAQEA